MVEFAEDIKTIPLKTGWKKIGPPVKTVPPFTVLRRSKKREREIKRLDETISFDQYIMPRQPQGYIRCPRYDFF